MTDRPRPPGQDARHDARHDAGHDDEPPPFLGSWRNVYLLLLGELGLLVVLFALLRRWAS